MHRTKVRVAKDALDANTTIAAGQPRRLRPRRRAGREPDERAGRRQDDAARARCSDGLDGVRVGVLEGDVQGSLDADRLSALHVPVTQLNTDTGFGGECHLDANMVRSALPEMPLDEIDLLLIENVGNLVCPAEFRVGEDARAMVSSVAEGEDKPLKYPLMFRTCELVVVNKIDLLPHLDFDLDALPGQPRVGQSRVERDARRAPARARAWTGFREWLAGGGARGQAAPA